MAISCSWVPSLKVFLISTGIASLALLIMNHSVPFITHFVLHQIPLIWSALVTLSKPPYLYFLVNCIIITIAVSSRFHHHKLDGRTQPEPTSVGESSKPPPPSDLGYGAVSDLPEFGGVGSTAAYEGEVVEKSVVVSGDEMVVGEVTERDVGLTPSLERSVFADVEVDYVAAASSGKPLVSSRFGHRKPLKASPEGGRSLRVAKPKRQETLESTWKAITDGRRHMPLTRHLNKSGSFENHGSRQSSGTDHSPPPQVYRKSETFRDRTNYDPQPPANPSPKLRKEASLSKDELNRRVEAFIKKFNDEMRLQRQESMNHYIQMINRGAH